MLPPTLSQLYARKRALTTALLGLPIGGVQHQAVLADLRQVSQAIGGAHDVLGQFPKLNF